MKKSILISMMFALMVIASGCQKEEMTIYEIGTKPTCIMNDGGWGSHVEGPLTMHEVSQETYEDVMDRVDIYYTIGDCPTMSFKDINGNYVGYWNSIPESDNAYFAKHSTRTE